MASATYRPWTRTMKPLLACALTCALLLTGLPFHAPARAENSIKYLDDQGNTAFTPNKAKITEVTSTLTTWDKAVSEWYYLPAIKGNLVQVADRITVTGAVNLILGDSATLDAQGGIDVGSGDSLTIYAQSAGDGRGELVAGVVNPLDGYAGIGGSNAACGTVKIHGGTVTATGGVSAAGIGGSSSGAGGQIEITGGTVTATGGAGAAGVGGGIYGDGGKIEITGGVVTATGQGGGAGIGGGYGSDGGTIEIQGGIVKATAMLEAVPDIGGGAGIGGGGALDPDKPGGASGKITIGAQADVTATGCADGYRGGGAGIGSGGGRGVANLTGSADDIHIAAGAKVRATGGLSDAHGDGACIGTGGGGSLDGMELILIDPQPMDVTAYVGDAASFEVAAQKNGLFTKSTIQTITYQWEKKSGDEWKPVSGATGATYAIASLTGARRGEYRCVVSGIMPSKSATLTVKSLPTPPKPTPGIGEDAVFTGTIGGGAEVAVPVNNGAEGMALELLVGGKVIRGALGGDGVARFPLAPGALEPGSYPLVIRSPGGDPMAEAGIGHLIIKYRPEIAGDDVQIAVAGYHTALKFRATVSGSDPNAQIGVSVMGATPQKAGNGPITLSCQVLGTLGDVAIMAQAAATETTEAIPETRIGTAVVIPVPTALQGAINGTLGPDWTLIPVAEGVWLAVQGATVDEDGVIRIKQGAALRLMCSWNGTVPPTAILDRIRELVFGVKDYRPVQAPPSLRATGAVDPARQLAEFAFSAQEMGRLVPGDYRFSVNIPGVGPVTLATVRVEAAEAEPVTWTMPQSLRVSVGQVYQLVKPVAEGAVLPALTIRSKNTKVAIVNGAGAVKGKSVGKATIKALAQDGSVLSCTLTVVPNRFERKKPLYVKEVPGVYTSTKKLAYEKGRLKVEVFVANTTGAPIRDAAGYVMELYDGEQLLLRVPCGPLRFTLGDRKYGAYKATVTEALLAGVEKKALDLGGGRIQAVIRGDGAVPLVAATPGAVQAKGAEVAEAAMP